MESSILQSKNGTVQMDLNDYVDYLIEEYGGKQWGSYHLDYKSLPDLEQLQLIGLYTNSSKHPYFEIYNLEKELFHLCSDPSTDNRFRLVEKLIGNLINDHTIRLQELIDERADYLTAIATPRNKLVHVYPDNGEEVWT
jgi:hypothetical protein